MDGDDVVFGSGVVTSSTFMGSRYRIEVDVDGRRFVVESNRGSLVPETGVQVNVTWHAHAGVLVDPQTSARPTSAA